MPRPHYPTTGGPHLPSWNTSEARQRHHPQQATPNRITKAKTDTVAPSLPASTSSPRASADGASRKGASNNRSRPSRSNNPPASLQSSASMQTHNRSGASAAMLYAAAFLAVAALLFTLLALLHHG